MKSFLKKLLDHLDHGLELMILGSSKVVRTKSQFLKSFMKGFVDFLVGGISPWSGVEKVSSSPSSWSRILARLFLCLLDGGSLRGGGTVSKSRGGGSGTGGKGAEARADRSEPDDDDPCRDPPPSLGRDRRYRQRVNGIRGKGCNLHPCPYGLGTRCPH